MIINQVATGGAGGALTGDALVGDVLAGKTFYNNDANTKLTGTASLVAVTDGIVVTARDGSDYATAVDHYGDVGPDQYKNVAATNGPWKALTSISFETAVTSIGVNAFYACGAFTGITLPSGVTAVGNGAFMLCDSLASISIPDGVTTLGNTVFYACTDLATVTAPGVVTVTSNTSGNATFWNCTALTAVQLGSVGNPVTSISVHAFTGCTQGGLTITIYVTPGAQPLANSPWGATSATIAYKSAADGSDL